MSGRACQSIVMGINNRPIRHPLLMAYHNESNPTVCLQRIDQAENGTLAAVYLPIALSMLASVKPGRLRRSLYVALHVLKQSLVLDALSGISSADVVECRNVWETGH
jgi:hypothetical protein